ncbi:MAG: ribosomal protein S18-alanine N-acetyltransferase [Chloroflexi bacterium]|nr:ribosomal protein S18-alanine N-acetyltransferase [Chloroflexota bacterium]
MTSTFGTLRLPVATAAAKVEAFYVRPVEHRDAAMLSTVEREAFPSQWPPTRFSREIARRRTSYLAAARELPNSLDSGRCPVTPRPTWRSGKSAEQGRGILGRIAAGLKQISFVDSFTGAEPPRDYVAGFVGVWFIANEAHIVSLGVRPKDHRKGVGELLMLGAFREARRYGARDVTLEVRASNFPAQALYRKYGFREVALRKRYYLDNGEDAIIMTTPPIANVEYAISLDSLARSHAVRWGHVLQPAAR